MKQFWQRLHKNKITYLLFIMFVAALLRFYRLNEIPFGFYWDEAAITYNAYGIAEWNRDEHGNKLPISFKSYGDYKAPLLIYGLGILYKIIGLQPELLRISTAILGLISVFILYLIAKALKINKLVVAALMAITPWGVNFSRIGVEVTLALFLVLLGFYCFLKSKEKSFYLVASSLAFGLSLYAYHSTKIFVPLLIISILLFFKKHIFINWKPLVVAVITFSVIALPLAFDTLKGQGFERGKTMILYDNGHLASFPIVTTKLLKNISSYLSPQFWLMGNDAIGLRHSVPNHGVIYYSIALLFLIGLSTIHQTRNTKFLVVWFLIGLLPSLLTNDTPHAIRSMLALPALILIATIGFDKLIRFSKWFEVIVGMLLLIETTLYINSYYSTYAEDSATAFQYGYKQAILTAESIGKDADKIIITDYYGQPYIYTLLYRQLTPEEFKFGALANYEFHRITWPDSRPNRIYVATPDEIPPTDPTVVKVIMIPNTTMPVFVISKT